MDWYSIEYLYPSSFKKFTNVMFPNVGVLSLSTLEFYDTKKLYYFFDKEGTIICNPDQQIRNIAKYLI